MRKSVYLGSAWGVLAWGVYGAGEVASFVLRPVLAGYQEIVMPAQWTVIAISLVAYLLAGAALGGLAGAAAAGWSDGAAFMARRFAVSTLPIAYLSNLLVNLFSLDTSSHVGLAVALILLAGVFAAAVRRARDGIFAIAGDPWTAVMLLLGAPLLISVGALRLAAFVAGAGVLFMINARLLNGGKRIGGFPVRQAFALSIALPAVLLATWGAAGKELEPIRSFKKTASAGRRPNILLVVMDTVRADHTSLYGYSRDTNAVAEELCGKSHSTASPQTEYV